MAGRTMIDRNREIKRADQVIFIYGIWLNGGKLAFFGIFQAKPWKYDAFLFTLYFKVLFMNTANRPGPAEEPSETLRDIKRMMERSSRFISLSGLSGVSAGICALAGDWIALRWMRDYYGVGGYVAEHGYR